MNRTILYFTGPEQLSLREEKLISPAREQVLVRVLQSAISPGTEMLMYRGQFPAGMERDASIAALAGMFTYPFTYGYCSVGQVVAVGDQVNESWLGQKVFAFQPHQSAYIAEPQELLPLPPEVSVDQAVFLPNMETAVNLLMDGRPMIGETVAVFGQGIVGLLVSTLLADIPLGGLAVWDHYLLRRTTAEETGVALALDPSDPVSEVRVQEWLAERGSTDGFDLIYELSGAPAALEMALAMAGFATRVVIGSWYGSKRASLDLGGRFHRSRVQILSSQVSSLSPDLTGRWTKDRRMAIAWKLLEQVQPQRWITQRFPFHQVEEAYRLIAAHPEQTIQVVLEYNGEL